MYGSLGIFHSDDAYGRPFPEIIQARFEAEATTASIVGVVPVGVDRATYATEIGMMAGLSPDCIAYAGFGGDAGTLDSGVGSSERWRLWTGFSPRPAGPTTW